jgi:hypothetical protein
VRRLSDGSVGQPTDPLRGHSGTLAQARVDLLDVEQHENAGDNDDIQEQPRNRIAMTDWKY